MGCWQRPAPPSKPSRERAEEQELRSRKRASRRAVIHSDALHALEATKMWKASNLRMDVRMRPVYSIVASILGIGCLTQRDDHAGKRMLDMWDSGYGAIVAVCSRAGRGTS